MSNRPGFGLIEAIAAVVVIGMVGIASMATIAVQNDLAFRARTRIEATALAEYRLNEFGVTSRETLIQLSGRTISGAFSAPFAGYRWDANIDFDVASNVFDTRVVVRWGEIDSAAMSTAFYRP